ncbi:tether containing UBX domain for GLUT4-like [Asbolus verrucosus]|uniref:Tether containing UBX domain for GLUT4-like n=1 Tax=Asbolus verrucosus TaxID=1661398 RepID=A0A482VX47_ASBVE|nr:tether containing UBX domain for GLUT4-like [Asbolus verrucosus]
MSSSVSVLAPNGRRQTVKCTANTTILQIIEEVCRKQGFKPEDYDIKHHNKVLDTTISFRFSGLPNNAQLELATATKARLDSEVILAINLENGNRMIGNFLPDETLSVVLSKLCPDEIKPNENPVVIYMRNEIYGSNLERTTLRSLGLRGGRAMMRLMHRTPDELKTQANVSAPLPAKVVEEKPYFRTLKTEETPLSSLENTETKSKPIEKTAEVDLLKMTREKRKLNFSPVKSLETEPQLPKSRPKIEPKEEAMEVDVNETSPLQRTKEEDFVFLGERNAMLFSLESARSVPAEDLPDDFFELTIDDAKKILNDIRRRRQDMENATLMTSAMRTLEESKKQLRQLNKYKQSVIRVQFPDRTILQGTFKPIEMIKDVNDFVRNYLQDRTCNFYLYTTPPKCILSEEDRLMEIGCVPGALLHLGADPSSCKVHLKEELRDKFTTNSMASLAASKMRKEATRAGTESPPHNYKMDQDNSMDTLADDLNAPGPSSQPTSYERKVIKSTEKVPKWFKPV